MDHILLSLTAQAPGGFSWREKLVKKEMLGCVFALYAPSLEKALEELSKFGDDHCGLIVTLGTAKGIVRVSGCLFHLTVAPECLPHLADMAASHLALLEPLLQSADELKGLSKLLDRSLDDKQRQKDQFNNLKLSLLKEINERKAVEEKVKIQEAELRDILENLPVGAAWANFNNQCCFINNKFQELFGYGLDEIRNLDDWFLLAYPDEAYRESIKNIWATTLGDYLSIGTPIEPIHTCITCKSGAVLRIVASVQIIADKILCIFNDITDLKYAQGKLAEAKELFSLFMKHSPIYIYIKDVSPNSSRVIQASDNFVDMVGIKGSDMAGKTMEELFPPEFAAKITADDWDVVTRGEVLRLDEDLGDRNYTTIKFPIRRGEKSLLAGYTIDITDRKQAELSLKESETRYRALFDFGADGIVVIDPATASIVDFNEQACRQLGYSPEEFRSIKISDLEMLETMDETRERIRKVMREGFGEFETVQRTKLGEPRFVHVKAQYTSIGGRHLYHCIWRDITKAKKDEQILQARVHLTQFSLSHNLSELLTETLDKLEELTGSTIGFFHFLNDDQRTITLHTWSTKTVSEFCRAQGAGGHYDVEKAGVWVDCIKSLKPVIHNDYPSLAHRKGLPEGHAPIKRELVFPIMRLNKIVAIIGIGNKSSDYTEEDVSTISRFADLAWEIAERKLVQESLRESNERFGVAFNSAPIMTTISNMEDGTYLDVNRRFCEVSGFGREEAIGRTSIELGWITEGDRARLVEEMKLKGRVHDMEIKLHSKFGDEVLCKYWGEVITVGGNKRLLSIALDVTAHRKIEQQLLQSQKMESVGRLAGGVAHDFNNMLGVILGHAEIALLGLDPNHPLHQDLDAIQKAAERSANLTRQLLAFARKQAISPRVIDLNDAVEGMLTMLRRLIGEDIELAWFPKACVWPVNLDPAQVDQILANFCINARDAIKGVGSITIETDNVHVPESAGCGREEISGGDYVSLAVSDNGCGMDRATLDMLFEPFFTTKGVGKGTGLGLATVYGIVKQNGGYIKVDSEPGAGTTFRIFLPRYAGGECGQKIGEKHAPLLGGSETVLLVEDEESIRKMTATMLSAQGYTVLQAGSPLEAIDLAQRSGGRFDLLMTDVIMPEMNGYDLAERLLGGYPQVKALFMSGYTADVIARHGVLDGDVNFLHKPFSMSEMAQKVRKALDG